MLSVFHKLSVSTKLGLIFTLSLSALILYLILFYQGLKSSVVQEQKQVAKHLSDMGQGVIQSHYQKYRSGILSEAEAKAAALRQMQQMRYGEFGYFWINDVHGVMLMHPHVPELVNTDVSDRTDAKGFYLFRSFVETALQGGGIVEYHWSKPDTTETFPKMSYLSLFEPWGWVLGTGIYVDEMEKEIQEYAENAISIVVLFIVFFSLLSTYFIRGLVNQLNSAAIRDPLTSLYSRRYLIESTPTLERKAFRHQDQILSVIYIDVDLFKQINDRYGHHKGDQVLTFIGESIQQASRPDDICVRFGGEEFLIVTFSARHETAEVLMERIAKRVSEHEFQRGNQVFSVTLSAGIARHRRTETLEETIKRADHCLYRAKESGRNNTVVEEPSSALG